MRNKEIFLIIGILATITIGRIIHHFYSGKDIDDLSKLHEFMRENSINIKNKNEDIICFVFITPLDCSDCSRILLRNEFTDSLNNIFASRNISASYNYMISGDFTTQEKYNYVKNITNRRVNKYIDVNNNLKKFLLMNEKNILTPLMIIYYKNRNNLYKTYFSLSERERNYMSTYKRIYKEIRRLH